MNEHPRGPVPSWTDSLTGVLSPEAIDVFERLGVRRDPAQTCEPDALAALLKERGLPVVDAVLELERRFGGVTWKGDTFGACAALRSGVDLRTLAGLAGGDIEDYLGEPFLPVSFRSQLPRAYFWMNAAGQIYLSHEADSFPAADTAACFWEREALKADETLGLELRLQWSAMPTFTDADFARFEARGAEQEEDDEDEDEAPPRRYDEDPQATFDERFAAALGLPLFGPATDRWRRVWFDGTRLLYPHYPWQPPERVARAGDMDSLVEMARAAREVRPSVLATYRGPLGAPPGPGEPVVAKLLTHEERSGVVGDLLFIGTPGAYRVHLQRRDPPQSLHRIWEEREAAWKTRSAGPGTDRKA